jgi:hypothetical protein
MRALLLGDLPPGDDFFHISSESRRSSSLYFPEPGGCHGSVYVERKCGSSMTCSITLLEERGCGTRRLFWREQRVPLADFVHPGLLVPERRVKRLTRQLVNVEIVKIS